MNNVLEIIKKERKNKKISQEEIAKKMGIARTTYQAIELGNIKLTFDDFIKIIKVLEIPITTFTNKNLIVISDEDLIKLNKASELLNSVTSKISEASYITIGDNNNIQIGNNNKGK